MEFVPGPVPAERDAVELDLFPLDKHGCHMELIERHGPNGWPIITIEGDENMVLDLLRRAHVELETVETVHEKGDPKVP